MSRVFSKFAVTTLMLIAFVVQSVGQSFAYNAVACEMAVNAQKSHRVMASSAIDHANMSHANMSHANMSQHEMMDHSTNKSDTNQISMNQSHECCGADCVCPANTCSSAIVLLSQLNSNEVMPLKDAVNLMQDKLPNSIPTSLFRPPIFA